MNDAIRNLHEDISNDLDRIKKRFKGTPRLSLIVRFPEEPDKGLYLTDDTKAGMIGQIEFLERHSIGCPEDLIEAQTGPLAQGRGPATAAGKDS